MNKNKLNFFGVLLALAGFAITMLSNSVNDLKQEALIEDKVNKVLSKRKDA